MRSCRSIGSGETKKRQRRNAGAHQPLNRLAENLRRDWIVCRECLLQRLVEEIVLLRWILGTRVALTMGRRSTRGRGPFRSRLILFIWHLPLLQSAVRGMLPVARRSQDGGALAWCGVALAFIMPSARQPWGRELGWALCAGFRAVRLSSFAQSDFHFVLRIVAVPTVLSAWI